MKKRFIAGILTLGLAFTATSCDSVDFEKILSDVTSALGIPSLTTPKEIKLVDFEATVTDESYKIGDLYELRRMVTDEDGNEYALNYVVKDSTGKEVSVIANCFEITDIAGYTVTYTVSISDDDVRTSVVTVPVHDGDAPIITIGAVVAGAIGEEYVLPEISFSDLSEIVETSVKVYYVEESLTEVTLTESEGEYSFLPSEAGAYRLSVYAKDAAGNETTRTADFIVEKILVGEVFNPVASSATSQISFGSNNNVFSGSEKEFVTAEENTDLTYGNSYVRIVAANPNAYGNLLLSPRFAVSEYADYETVNVWVYVESKLSTPINVLFFNDTALTQKVEPNQWTLVSIPSETFFTHISDVSRYFVAVQYDENTTAIRLGEILAVNHAEVSVSDTADVVLNGESVNVEFSVTANPTDTEYVVEVKNSVGETQEVVSLGNGNYKATLTALGDYTITATAFNGKYGVGQTSFSVLDANRIVVEGEYAKNAAMGKPIDLHSAYVQRGDNTTDEVVTVKVYRQNGADWEDVTLEIVNGEYTPTTECKLQVEYTATGVTTVTYEIEVFDYSVIFNPALENAATQVAYGTNNKVFDNAEKVFVTADENTDTTYGGAYLLATPTQRINWGNVFVTPKYTANDYLAYDAVKAWVYVVSGDNTQATALFCNQKYTQSVTPNQWVEIVIPMETYLSSFDLPVFIGLNFNSSSTAITAVRIGEISAVNYAEITVSEIENATLTGESVDVEFSVTATPTDAEYVVEVKNSAGETQEVVSLGNGNYKTTLTVVGDYTVKVVALNGYYGVAETEFTVLMPIRIVVEDAYEESLEIDKEIALHNAYVQRGDNATDETVTVKVYTKNGTEWVDDSAKIVNGKYTPTVAGNIKVEYTATGVDTVSYEIEIYDPTVVFNPVYENATSQLVLADTNGVYAGSQKEFFSAESNTDETYGGAYFRIVPTNPTNYGNIFLRPQLDVSLYAGYETVSVWMYVESEVNDAVKVLFFNDVNLTQNVTPNQWVQITLPRTTFMTSTQFFCAIDYRGTATGLRIGEATAKDKVAPDSFFNPASVNAGGQVAFGTNNNIYTGSVKEFVSAEQNVQNNLPSSTKTANLIITPVNAVESFFSYTNMKIWVYVESVKATELTVFLWGVHAEIVATNQWVEVTVPISVYKENATNPTIGVNYNANGWMANAIRIGAIVAE